MTITLSSQLATSAEVAFTQVKRPTLLHYIAYPFIQFVPSTPFPAQWQPGEYQTQLHLFRLIPLGHQLIRIELPNRATDGSFRVRDNGQGHLAHTWDHWITIEPFSANRCRYTDRVTVKAGLLTGFVWLFALGFYAWRQYRWQRLVQLNFQPINNL